MHSPHAQLAFACLPSKSNYLLVGIFEKAQFDLWVFFNLAHNLRAIFFLVFEIHWVWRLWEKFGGNESNRKYEILASYFSVCEKPLFRSMLWSSIINGFDDYRLMETCHPHTQKYLLGLPTHSFGSANTKMFSSPPFQLIRSITSYDYELSNYPGQFPQLKYRKAGKNTVWQWSQVICYAENV